jgi:hypothetical protein
MNQSGLQLRIDQLLAGLGLGAGHRQETYVSVVVGSTCKR